MIKKILEIQKLLEKHNNKLWIMINKDNADSIFTKYISKNIYTLSMCFISVNKAYILIHDMDKDNLDVQELNKNNIKVVFYTNSSNLIEKTDDILSELRYLSPISLSYSTMGDKITDILGHGEFIKFTNIFKSIYSKYKKRIKFDSAENIIYNLLSTKTEKQIERIKFVSNLTHEILDQTFKEIFPGMREIDIEKHITLLYKRICKKYIGEEIINFKTAWEHCPFVLAGENLVKGGHTLPSEKVLKRGETIYIDFGLCAEYADGEKIYSDMQRMGYVLKKTETKIPRKIKKEFKVLVESIEIVLDKMKPGIKGYEIDDIVRNKIVKEGYPNYNHSTGHPVGLNVHDVGAILSNKSNKRACLELVENSVYTLEPRIAIHNGGSIEETFLVTKFGAIPICPMQKELYIIE